MTFEYVYLTALQLIFTYPVSYPLSFVLPLFCKDDGYLPNWLCWFQTQDAPLDAGWRDGYFRPVGLPQPVGWERYKFRVRWLWRNPAYGFCYWPLGLNYCPNDWIIDLVVHDGEKLNEFKAHTTDGRHFCYTNDKGTKLGYKLWWALDGDFKLMDKMPADKGPDNRLPICFSYKP